MVSWETGIEESFLKSGRNSIPKGHECKPKIWLGRGKRKNIFCGYCRKTSLRGQLKDKRSIQDSALIRLTAFAGMSSAVRPKTAAPCSQSLQLLNSEEPVVG